jgi:hypothetical protein
MRAIAENTYILMMFLAYLLRRAGTFSMDEKVKMIEFLSYMATHPDTRIAGHEGAGTLLGEVMRSQPLRVDHLSAPSRVAKTPECSLRL